MTDFREPAISRRVLMGALVTSTVASVATYRWVSSVNTVKDEPAPEDKPVKPTTAKVDPATLRATFYDETIEPKIFETDLRNRQAADRTVDRLNETFADYHRGVDRFVEDLTSVATRLGIVKRMPGQWWSGDARIDAYVREKFEKYLFSEKTLLRDISDSLTKFRADVDANQRRMLVDVHTALSSSDLPQASIVTYESFYDSIANQLSKYSSDQGTASIYNALTILLISEAGSYVATSLVAGILARFGTAAAVSSVAASGATAGGAAVGAGGGSFGGPVGAVVGFGVGLAVGLIIDWWMTEKFEGEMAGKMHEFVNSLQNTVLYGDAERTKSNSSFNSEETANDGIAGALPVVCDRLLDAYRQRFYESIVLGVSS